MNEQVIYPNPLKEGDKVCLIDPANTFTEAGIRASLMGLSSMGFQAEVSEDMAFKRGSREERAERLNRVFRNTEYRGIFCIWGGYGTMPILDLLDYEAIAKNRPAFVGFSDITAMHLAIQKKTGLVTFHGRSNSKDEPLTEITKQELLGRLTAPEIAKKLENPDGSPINVIREGYAEGILTGGNLTMVTRLMGTPYEIDTKGKILFLEEVGEKPYVLHGMMTQLMLSGKLNDAAGIILGRFQNCDIGSYEGSGYANVLEVLSGLQVPILGNLQAGHIYETLTLPLGKPCRIDGNIYI